MYTVLLYTHGAYNSLLNTVTYAQKNVDCFDYIYTTAMGHFDQGVGVGPMTASRYKGID